MSKFIPTEEQVAKATRIAQRNNRQTIFMNARGECFLDENLAKGSVTSFDDYIMIHLQPSGKVYLRQNKDHVVTQEDLDNNPMLAQFCKPGDTIQIPVPVSEQPAKAVTVDDPDDAGNSEGSADNGTSEGAAAAGAGKETEQPQMPFDITTLSEKKVRESIASIENVNILEYLLKFEQAGSNRKGVTAALTERMEALK